MSLSNITAGVQADGAGIDITDEVIGAAHENRKFIAKFYSTSTLGAAWEDYDGDGLSNHEEIFTHRTDPRNPDTDSDGLWDAEELERGFAPDIADSLGDGTLDFWRVYDESILTNAPWAEDGGFIYEIKAHLTNCAPDAYAVLRVGKEFMPITAYKTAYIREFLLNRGENSYFTYIPGSGLTGSEELNIAVTDIAGTILWEDMFFYIEDPAGIFEMMTQPGVAPTVNFSPYRMGNRAAPPGGARFRRPACERKIRRGRVFPHARAVVPPHEAQQTVHKPSAPLKRLDGRIPLER